MHGTFLHVDHVAPSTAQPKRRQGSKDGPAKSTIHAMALQSELQGGFCTSREYTMPSGYAWGERNRYHA